MRPIQIGDNFTLGELETFTLGELSLPIDELLELVRTENRSIPVSAYEKLIQLYNELVTECQNSDNENLKSIKFPKLQNISEISKSLIPILKCFKEIIAVAKASGVTQIIIDRLTALLKMFLEHLQ